MDWYAKFVQENWFPSGAPVLDIGCNDGSQLSAFKKIGFDTYGVDPAKNLYEKSSANHKVVCGFWDEDSAKQLGDVKFGIISTQNAFAHNPNPLAYLKLCKEYLADHGRILISTSQADMVLNGEFDTIYHEHISYYNAESMKALAERAGLYLVDVIKTPIHGTSYIFVLSATESNQMRMENTFAMEAKLHQGSTYRDWASDVNKLLVTLKKLIDNLREYGYTIVGYGAAAKGMTLINASNIRLDCVIDDNPLKQGLYCPGTSIPVVGIDWLDGITDPNEKVVFIPLAWNFYNEIKKKIKAKRDNTEDVFLRYFPEIKSEVDPQNQFLK
jgi:2-polyprenyl-3-methyl-5-hydroxy-6-metoxy-1,4-benzoquinol methylase